MLYETADSRSKQIQFLRLVYVCIMHVFNSSIVIVVCIFILCVYLFVIIIFIRWQSIEIFYVADKILANVLFLPSDVKPSDIWNVCLFLCFLFYGKENLWSPLTALGGDIN